MQAARGAAVAPTEPADPAADPPPRPRVAWLAVTAALVLAADAGSKAVVVAQLSHHAPVSVIPSVLRLTLTRNGGAAFSVGTGATVVFSVVAVAVAVVIVRSARRLGSAPWALTLGLLLGGALGNLSDRLFRAPAPLRGRVVDWIELPHWPVFNLADSAIVVGGLLTVLLTLRGIEMDGTRRPAGRA